ncbi:MAG: box helicase protein [Bacillota bacterium]|nr:box helicase protein [Bacillota bacterium]MDK2925862.1 box helicase protein [Bacillota bacterium]
MDVERILRAITTHPCYQGQITYRRHLPGRSAAYAEPAGPLPPELQASLERAGVRRLYTHQAAALDAARRGENIVVVTPTASGKTLCYNLPVLAELLTDPLARALYIFPTKALTQDQLKAVQRFGLVPAAVYDGDTPDTVKAEIRETARIVLTNPDMLHLGVLPNHLKWHDFLAHLKFVVIDEIHAYRGVFGTQVAHILRRLRRLAAHHGANPQFILTSATIANPAEHAERLTGLPVTLIEGSGAPQGARDFLFWRVPQHTTYLREVVWLLEVLLQEQARTIAFARARQVVERILRQVRRELAPPLAARLTAYRGGYLAVERREIELELFSGRLLGVVATNALELGIDVGEMEVCLIAGYPGTIASTWQQAGRVGRRERDSLIIFIAVANPLDQYFLRHPEAFFEKPTESALIDTANPYLLLGQARCAAQELPLTPADLALWDPVLVDLLTILEEDGQVTRADGRWFYTGQDYPAEKVNLRTTGRTFQLRDRGEKNRLVGTMDGHTAFSEAYPGAIYLHQGETYRVEELDIPGETAYLRRVDVDYYTMVGREKSTEILETLAEKELYGHRFAVGRLRVRTRVTGYIKKHELTGQVLGGESLSLPEEVLETVGMWFSPSAELTARVRAAGLDLMGGLHAVEHAAIALLPLYAMCDRGDVGGLSTILHPQTGEPTVFIHDAYEGGVGFAEKGYEKAEELLAATLEAVAACPCENGCPSCIHSPKCSNFNRPLDKEAAICLLHGLLGRTYEPAAPAGIKALKRANLTRLLGRLKGATV